MWPFRKKEKPSPRDARVWNEDWKVGDIAECMVNGIDAKWHDEVLPWRRPEFGARLTVSGFSEGLTKTGDARAYFLHFSDWPVSFETTAFRKIRPVATEESEVVQRILTTKPGKDKVRERT